MMDLVEMTVKLPADLVRDARELEILTDEAITQLLRQEVDRRVNEIVNEKIHIYRAGEASKIDQSLMTRYTDGRNKT